jgi:hypothetical protein
MVVDVIFVDERTGEVIPMTAKDKDKEKKKLGWLKYLGIFVVGYLLRIFYWWNWWWWLSRKQN